MRSELWLSRASQAAGLPVTYPPSNSPILHPSTILCKAHLLVSVIILYKLKHLACSLLLSCVVFTSSPTLIITARVILRHRRPAAVE